MTQQNFCASCGNACTGSTFCAQCGAPLTAAAPPHYPHANLAPAAPPMPPMPPAVRKQSQAARISLVLGLLSIAAWFLPLVGYPITMCAALSGYFGQGGPRHKEARAGFILGIVFLGVTLINSIAGIIMAL